MSSQRELLKEGRIETSMANSRTKNTTFTAFAGICRSTVGILTSFISRTVFIYILGAEFLSLNGLFSNILLILALAELGIGSAITFYLYQPIADNNIPRIKSLMRFYKVCYRVVGLLIVGLGLCLVPLLPLLVNFETELTINLYVVYILYLLNSGTSYLLNAYKQSFLQANQMGYKIENINSIFLLVNCIIDVFVLIVGRNFIAYLVTKLFLGLMKNIYMGHIADKVFPFLKENAVALKWSEIKKYFGDLYNVLIFNLGDRLLNATDNIIISVMLGTLSVGYYSNYYMIILQVKTFYSLVLSSFRAGIGDVIARNNEKKYDVYKQVDIFNQMLCTCSTVGMFQILNSFMTLWVGRIDARYVLSQEIVLMIVLNVYYDNSTWVINMFREVGGSFEIGRYIALITGVVNIILSIALAKPLGLFGVLLATVISKFGVAVVPFVSRVGNRVFDGRGMKFVIEYYKNFGIMCISMGICWLVCSPLHGGSIIRLIAEAALCFFTLILLMILFYGRKEEFRELCGRMLRIAKNNNSKNAQSK